QEMEKRYQQAGYPRMTVTNLFTMVELSGKAIATFEITESRKVRISEIRFVGAQAFSQRKLRHVIKTRQHWMFSWLTRSDILKEDVFEEYKEKLREYYRDHGYLDFEFKGEPEMINASARRMIIRFNIYEGKEYKVGVVKFSGNK